MGALPLPFLQCNVYEFSFSLSSKRTEVGTKVYCHLRSYRRKRYNFIEPVHRYLEEKKTRQFIVLLQNTDVNQGPLIGNMCLRKLSQKGRNIPFMVHFSLDNRQLDR